MDGLRKAWSTHWNNPERDVEREGLYFQTRIGPLHYVALDTRSCREHERKGEKGCFLGKAQNIWLKKQIEKSDAPCLIISGGTMRTDFISDGKDSWGTWDKEGREEIFQWIDVKKDQLVILLSGDRHGARGFKIPRENGGTIYELEVGTLGGVPGPPPFGADKSSRLFGYPSNRRAFGELTFSTGAEGLNAEFRLINESGKEIETLPLKR